MARGAHLTSEGKGVKHQNSDQVSAAQSSMGPELSKSAAQGSAANGLNTNVDKRIRERWQGLGFSK